MKEFVGKVIMRMRLEEAAKRGKVSLEKAIERRKSRRSFKRTKLTK
jgi:hypothetical protein